MAPFLTLKGHNVLSAPLGLPAQKDQHPAHYAVLVSSLKLMDLPLVKVALKELILQKIIQPHAFHVLQDMYLVLNGQPPVLHALQVQQVIRI
jgi:hypothetical protein